MPNVIFVLKFNARIESFVETMMNRRKLLLNGASRRCSSLRLKPYENVDLPLRELPFFHTENPNLDPKFVFT